MTAAIVSLTTLDLVPGWVNESAVKVCALLGQNVIGHYRRLRSSSTFQKCCYQQNLSLGLNSESESEIIVCNLWATSLTFKGLLK